MKPLIVVVESPRASVVFRPSREVLSAKDSTGSGLWMRLYTPVIFLVSRYSGRHTKQFSLQDRCALSFSTESASFLSHSALQSQ